MAKSKKGEAELAAAEWEPISDEEIQKERATQLLYELEEAKRKLDEHSEQGRKLKASIRDLKRQMKTAKRLSVKQRARINSLDRQWRRQWVKEYERFRAEGKDKRYASALAWSQIKVHCTKDDNGVWQCPPWRGVYMEGKADPSGVVYLPQRSKAAKTRKRKKKSAKKKPKKTR